MYNSTVTCSKCGLNQSVQSHRWCKICLRNYQREVRKKAKNRAEARAATAQALRAELIRKFDGVGTREMNGFTASAIVRETLPA